MNNCSKFNLFTYINSIIIIDIFTGLGTIIQDCSSPHFSRPLIAHQKTQKKATQQQVIIHKAFEMFLLVSNKIFIVKYNRFLNSFFVIVV